ncbi:MAG: hypothetical protein KAI24_15465 [Planctomycetes bacterium]|nr:hypothetical protein [Planctomycetota bacterium]
MSITLLIALFVGPTGLVLLSSRFMVRQLGDRIRLLRRSLLLLAAPIVVLGISLMATAQVRPPSKAQVEAGAVPQAWFEMLREAQTEQLLGFGTLAFAVFVVAVQAAMVLGELASFVNRHETDLAARDQIALHAEK